MPEKLKVGDKVYSYGTFNGNPWEAVQVVRIVSRKYAGVSDDRDAGRIRFLDAITLKPKQERFGLQGSWYRSRDDYDADTAARLMHQRTSDKWRELRRDLGWAAPPHITESDLDTMIQILKGPTTKEI